MVLAGDDYRRQCSPAAERACVWSAQIYALRCGAWTKAKEKNSPQTIGFGLG